jgi:serine protease
MGKIKIGLIILGSIALVGLVVAGVGLAKNGSNNGKAEYVQDEIIVKFKGDKEPFRVLKVPEGKVGEKIKEFKKRADVIYAEPNYLAYALMTPNDPYYKYQWHLDNSVYGGIQMEEAWDISTGAGVTVAVVDTGIRKGTDLANTCFVSGYDFVNSDTDPTDDNGHGTHVAGTVAQSTNNGVGVAGVAYKSCLMPVKVLDATGAGTYANVALGIRYAADNGAKVINLSLGGSEPSDTLEGALAYAYGKGVTVVAAAGNDSSPTLSYPAAYDAYVIAVGATRYDETLAYYSNYGPSLDLVAPGGDLNVDQNGDGYGDGVLQQTFRKTGRVISWGYYFFQGTSMAAPHVSGVAALLIANGNATTQDQVRTALQETAEDLGATGRDDTYGYGLVNAYAALGWTAAKTCSTDADCSDGLYCNGTEVCVAGVCQTGTPINCSDGVACTVDSCDETIKACVNTPNNALCDDGVYCNGAETCDATLGCQAGTPVVCDDGNECTTDSCNESLKACENIKVDDNTACTDGVCCSGICQIGIAACPTAVKCWSGTNLYLYRATDQAKKFCKCAQGSYGYNSYKYNRSIKTVYKYTDTADNTIWDVTSLSAYGPISSVTCTDGKAYPTNLDYYYPK